MAYAGNAEAGQMVKAETHWGKLKNILKNWSREEQLSLMAHLCEDAFVKFSKRRVRKGTKEVAEAMKKLREFIAKGMPLPRSKTGLFFLTDNEEWQNGQPYGIRIPQKNHRDWARQMLYAILEPKSQNYWRVDCLKLCKEELNRFEFADAVTLFVLKRQLGL